MMSNSNKEGCLIQSIVSVIAGSFFVIVIGLAAWEFYVSFLVIQNKHVDLTITIEQIHRKVAAADLDPQDNDTLSHEARKSLSEIADFLSQQGIRFPCIVMAQVIVETGLLSSKVYKECNNPVGLKHSDRGYSIGVCNGHAMFNSVADGFRDYKAWQDDRLLQYRDETKLAVVTYEEYYLFLVRMRYAEDPLYVTKLEKWRRILVREGADVGGSCRDRMY